MCNCSSFRDNCVTHARTHVHTHMVQIIISLRRAGREIKTVFFNIVQAWPCQGLPYYVTKSIFINVPYYINSSCQDLQYRPGQIFHNTYLPCNSEEVAQLLVTLQLQHFGGFQVQISSGLKYMLKIIYWTLFSMHCPIQVMTGIDRMEETNAH